MAQSLKHKERELSGKEKLQEAVYGMADNLSEMSAATKEIAADSVEGFKEDLTGLYERGQEKMEGFERKIEAEVKEFPLRALAIATGVGFLIGRLLKKRK